MWEIEFKLEQIVEIIWSDKFQLVSSLGFWEGNSCTALKAHYKVKEAEVFESPSYPIGPLLQFKLTLGTFWIGYIFSRSHPNMSPLVGTRANCSLVGHLMRILWECQFPGRMATVNYNGMSRCTLILPLRCDLPSQSCMRRALSGLKGNTTTGQNLSVKGWSWKDSFVGNGGLILFNPAHLLCVTLSEKLNWQSHHFHCCVLFLCW